MPLYSYRCQACEHEFETLVRSGDAPACPKCASGDLARLVSLTAPEAKSPGILKQARGQAAREGHFSNYSRSELKRR